MDSAQEVVHYLNDIILNNRIEPDQGKLRQFGVKRQVEKLGRVLKSI
jgi:hypothetical protein